jgi:hypothetical protein
MSAVLENNLITIESLRIQSTPAILVGNFQELNTWLDTRLAEKVTVVTEETIKEEKSLVAELRKLGKAIDLKAKEVEAIVSGDIDTFRQNMKNLKAKVLSVADDKAAQVATLEAATKAEIAKMLQDTLLETWEQLGVEDEFRHASIDDLVKLTSRTPSGALTKAALKEAGNKAQADYSLQTKIKSRLVLLEVHSLKHDIPMLTRRHVEPFLFADDFIPQLEALVAAEVLRKAEAEERMRKKIEAENQAKIYTWIEDQRKAFDAEKQAAIEAERQRIAEENAKAYQAEKLEQQKQLELEAQEARLIQANAIYPDKDTQRAIKAVQEAKKQDTYIITIMAKITVTADPGADMEALKKEYVDMLARQVTVVNSRIERK